MQKVTRQSSGNYSCSAINAEGETVSNQLMLRVKCKIEIFIYFFLYLCLYYIKDSPFCITDNVMIVGAFRGENLNIICEVHADPPPRYNYIKFSLYDNKVTKHYYYLTEHFDGNLIILVKH